MGCCKMDICVPLEQQTFLNLIMRWTNVPQYNNCFILFAIVQKSNCTKSHKCLLYKYPFFSCPVVQLYVCEIIFVAQMTGYISVCFSYARLYKYPLRQLAFFPNIRCTNAHCTHAAVQLCVVQMTVIQIPYDRLKHMSFEFIAQEINLNMITAIKLLDVCYWMYLLLGML